MQDIAAIEKIIADGSLNGKIFRRTNEQPMRISVIDWIMANSGKDHRQANRKLRWIISNDPAIAHAIEWIHFSGKGQRPTPVTDARGLSLIKLTPPRHPKHPEKVIADALAQKIGGRREVRVESGIVDVVTSEYAIEVKYWTDWKRAIGQAFVYARDLKLKPKIHLYVPTNERHAFMCKVDHIKECIEAASIELSWESV